MKFTLITWVTVGVFLPVTQAESMKSAFVPHDSSSVAISSSVKNQLSRKRHDFISASTYLQKTAMFYSVQPEPEGGEEVSPIDTMPGSRMKNMGQDGDATSSGDGEQKVFTFWLEAEADGKLIKEYRTQVEKDASKKANFPGFRKGQIPPYAQPKMTMFAIQEGVIKTCEAAVSAYGLKALSGEAGSVEVHEDIKEICKGYKIGDPVKFTATFKATFNPEKKQQDEEQGEEEEVKVAEAVEE